MEGPLNLSKFILGFITNAGLTTLRLINCMNMIMDENQGMISHFLSDSREKIGNLLQTFWRQHLLKKFKQNYLISGRFKNCWHNCFTNTCLLHEITWNYLQFKSPISLRKKLVQRNPLLQPRWRDERVRDNV